MLSKKHIKTKSTYFSFDFFFSRIKITQHFQFVCHVDGYQFRFLLVGFWLLFFGGGFFYTYQKAFASSPPAVFCITTISVSSSNLFSLPKNNSHFLRHGEMQSQLTPSLNENCSPLSTYSQKYVPILTEINGNLSTVIHDCFVQGMFIYFTVNTVKYAAVVSLMAFSKFCPEMNEI